MRTVYGDISPRTAAFAVKKLLERGKYLLVTEYFGQIDSQGENKTKTRKYRRFESLARATAPLAEGISPAGQKLSASDITVNLEQYGDKVEITDVIADTHEDMVLDEAVKLCSEQIGETIETVRISVLKAGTNVFYASGVASRSLVNAAPTRGDFRKIVRYFKKYKAREMTELIAPTAKVSTFPVAPAYWALGHTDLDSDLRGISGFVPVEQYSEPSKAVMGEIGKIEGVRIVLTPLFEPWMSAGVSGSTFLSGGTATTGNADVYPLLFVARDAFAIVPLAGKNAVSPTVLNPGKPDKSDPLGQIGFVSWKMWQGCVILNQNWMARLECAATATPT